MPCMRGTLEPVYPSRFGDKKKHISSLMRPNMRNRDRDEEHKLERVSGGVMTKYSLSRRLQI